MDAFAHPDRKASFYSFDRERTGSKKLDSLPAFDWNPSIARFVDGNSTCLFPLALGCKPSFTTENKEWAEPMFDEDEEAFDFPIPSIAESVHAQKILQNIRSMTQSLPPGEVIREPDIQSPLGVAEILCGQTLYTALFDFPDEIKAMLERITDFEIAFIREMRAIAGERLNGAGFPFIWCNQTGTLCSDDTNTLLSAEMHAEFSIPYINKLAEAVGPLFYHSCSFREKYFDNVKSVKNVRAYNWNPGNSTDPKNIIREFSGRAVLAPHLAPGMHKTNDTLQWGNFADEVAMLEYILNSMQENTTLYFWIEGFSDDLEKLERIYDAFHQRGYTP